MSTGHGPFRKPGLGMWNFLCQQVSLLSITSSFIFENSFILWFVQIARMWSLLGKDLFRKVHRRQIQIKEIEIDNRFVLDDILK